MTSKSFLFIGLGALLLACQQFPQPSPVSLPSTSAVIKGRVTIQDSTPLHVSFRPDEGLPQQQVAVEADGQFLLPLPTAPYPDSSYIDPSCGGTAQQSNPRARFAELNGLVLRIWKNGERYAYVRNRRIMTTGSQEFVYVYATEATRLSGEQTCRTSSELVYRDVFDMNLGHGWNLVRITIFHEDVQFESVPFSVVEWR
ncbi:hypothetical protein [Deinococcus yavapaiensis]|uniref:Lipoprotein n=1 Tax=Deinococcus yavapaiensis KR-236 TaxID=694435 RepID=A0A318S2V0_9DEIO|nr:hypothetical protein [Deinococcus yavapaiensis]PYE47917.1 hypothetical protein DES52_1383 [Deinococcus yavapaiensis KR-236]